MPGGREQKGGRRRSWPSTYGCPKRSAARAVEERSSRRAPEVRPARIGSSRERQRRRPSAEANLTRLIRHRQGGLSSPVDKPVVNRATHMHLWCPAHSGRRHPTGGRATGSPSPRIRHPSRPVPGRPTPLWSGVISRALKGRRRHVGRLGFAALDRPGRRGPGYREFWKLQLWTFLWTSLWTSTAQRGPP